jgi:hypothetical protein
MSVFDRDHHKTEKRWNDLVIKKLDDNMNWIPRYDMAPTELSRWEVVWRRNFTFKEGGVRAEIGVYRDGFHITLKSPTTAHLSTENALGLSKKVFGEINRYTGWTPTIEKVAPMANAMVKEIKDYFKSLE